MVHIKKFVQALNAGQHICCRPQAVVVGKCLRFHSDYLQEGLQLLLDQRDVTSHKVLQDVHHCALHCLTCSKSVGAEIRRTTPACRVPSMSPLLQHWRHQPIHTLHVLHCRAEPAAQAAISAAIASLQPLQEAHEPLAGRCDVSERRPHCLLSAGTDSLQASLKTHGKQQR